MVLSSPLLSATATEGQDRVVLALHGEIDAATEGILTREVDAALAQRPATVVLDLGEVTFFGVRALSALIAARQAAVLQGCRLELCSLPPMAKRVIAAAGTSGLIETADAV